MGNIATRLKETRGIRVLDIDSLLLRQHTTYELSFWESKLLGLRKFFKKNAFLASFLQRIEVALFCNTTYYETTKEIESIKGLADDFFLIIATRRSFDELRKTPTFQYIVSHVGPEYLLVDGARDEFAAFSRAMGNRTTKILAAKQSSNTKAFLYPLLEWAGTYNISSRKIILVSDDAALCRTAREFSVGIKGASWLSLFSCPAT